MSSAAADLATAVVNGALRAAELADRFPTILRVEPANATLAA